MEGCYFCHHPRADIICSSCQVARYCSTLCQQKSERIFKHSTNLCPLERSPSSALPPIQQTSSLLGVRIEHDGVTLTTPDHIPVYEWFKHFIVTKGQVSPMMDPLPIDSWSTAHVRETGSFQHPALRERGEWLKNHQTNAERYAATVIEFAKSEGFSFGNASSEMSAARFFELVASACYKLDRNPQFFVKPHFYRSLTEQVWYYFVSSGDNVILKAYEEEERKKRFENKRKADEASLNDLAEELKEYKKQRISTLRHRIGDLNIKDLPYELLRLIAFCLPIRDILSFLHVLRKEHPNVYSEELVTKHIVQRDFYDHLFATRGTDQIAVRLLGKLKAKYEAIRDKAKSTFFDWFLSSSVLADMRPEAFLRAGPWWLEEQRSLISHVLEIIASLASKWTLPNESPTGILFLYYRTIGWTMMLPFIRGLKQNNNDPLVIVGATGLSIFSEYNQSLNVHQLAMQTPPISDIELAVARRIVEINNLLRENAADPDIERAAGPLVSFLTFLVTSVDPTVTVWASLKTIEDSLPPYNYYISTSDDITKSSRLKKATINVLANCIKVSLRYGARYEFDYNHRFSHIPHDEEKGKIHTKPYAQSVGAGFHWNWMRLTLSKVFMLKEEDVDEKDRDIHTADNDEDVLLL